MSGTAGTRPNASTEVVPELITDHTAIRAFRLEVIAGPDAGKVHKSEGERVVIGTHSAAHFVLTDRTVSRFHCEFELREGTVHLRDLSSRNGTRIDSVMVDAARVDGTCILKLGETQLRFELLSEQITIPLAPEEHFGGMVGRSKALRSAFRVFQRAADDHKHLIIEGEPGTGKTLAAGAVHERDHRQGPLGVVDCAGPAQEVERELFGYTSGAIPGVSGERPGVLETCNGGTVVLEEVAALDRELQSKLLRVLDAGVTRRLGGAQELPVSIRFIATSRRNLREEVSSGRFRSSLYYSLAVLTVRLPPLRERSEDLALLVGALLGQLGKREHPAAVALQGPQGLDALSRRTWPGNIRELRNHIERSIALHRVELQAEEAGEDHDAMPPLDIDVPLREARQVWIKYFERQYLSAMLERTGQNVSAAARLAGVDRVHLHRLLSKVGLR